MSSPGHELLNKDEFKDRLVALGYDDRALGKLFGTLVRSTLWSDAPRSSSDIGYYEINRLGELEAVLSVSNLAANLDNLLLIREIGTRSVAICRELVAPSGSS